MDCIFIEKYSRDNMSYNTRDASNVIERARLRTLYASYAVKRKEVEEGCVQQFEIDSKANTIHCKVIAQCTGKTGVEMEALTATSIALLTIYDMVKAVDRGMMISEIKLLEKQGGKSGHWKND